MFWPTLLSLLTASAASGAALGAALDLTRLFILHFFAGGATSLALDAVWNTFNSFTLSAIPLFILLGEILLRSGLSERVYTAITPVFTRVPGGLLHTNIAVCTIFGAVSGSSLSTAAAIGSVAYPEMRRRGYNRDMIVGSLAGGGTLGLLIPPSLSFLIFGALTETSIGRLFIAGIIPGLMVALMFMVYILICCLRNPSLYPRESITISMLKVLTNALSIWPILMLIFAIMGSIILGWATPTEAAAVGVAVAIIIAFLWGDFNSQKLLESFYRSVQLYAAIGLVIVGATILAQSVAILGVPQATLESAAASGLGKYGALALQGRGVAKTRLLDVGDPWVGEVQRTAGAATSHASGLAVVTAVEAAPVAREVDVAVAIVILAVVAEREAGGVSGRQRVRVRRVASRLAVDHPA